MNIKTYSIFKKVFFILIAIFLTIFGEFDIFRPLLFFINLVMIFRTLSFDARKRIRSAIIFLYLALSGVEFVILTYLYRRDFDSETLIILRNCFATFIIYSPIFLEKIFTVKKYVSLYFTPIDDVKTISFSKAKKIQDGLKGNLGTAKSVAGNFDNDTIKNLTGMLLKNNSRRYINRDAIGDDFFKIARNSLDDQRVYIIVSNTGSNLSEIISIFTNRVHNHASLSFDADLKTMVSYNGGNELHPPGLNEEILAYFNQKEDASIIVYSLECTREQKAAMIDKVEALNKEGNAYNLLGLILKTSLRPNILFCSQFVYKLLEYADLNYFEMRDGLVKPTDFPELDYYRKLKFEYELFLKDIFSNN